MHPSLSADAKQHVAWLQLQTKLNKLGPRPDPTPTNFVGNQELCTVLKRQRVQFKANVSMGSYAVDAVLQPCDSSCPQVLLRNATKPDFIRNMPGRLTGRAVFRDGLLGRYGKLVTLVYAKAINSSTEDLAGHIEQRVLAVTGLSLDAYRS